MKTFFPRCIQALSVVSVVTSGLFALPVVALLYCSPSIRAAFDQLAYEDVMRG